MGLSRSAIPPLICLAGFGLVCRLIIITCSTTILPVRRSISITRPCLPLSRPAITFTTPFFFSRIFTCSASVFRRPAMSDYLRRKRNDLHKLLVAHLARHRPEPAGTHRLVDFIPQHGRIRIEADIGAVLAARLFAHAHDHAADDLPLLDRGIGSGFFHRSGDDVAQPGPQSKVTATRQDTGQPACAAVIGDLEYRSHSNHKKLAFSSRYTSR